MNRIKEVLEQNGIKQVWLAEKLDKSFNMVNAYVQNRRQPSLKNIFKIAEILKVPAKDLLANESSLEEKISLQYEKTVKIPLLGNVACGLPIFAEENVEATIPISIRLIKKGYKYFLLRAKGSSMDNAGINDGDLVLIRHQQQAINGDRVVALIDDEATIKEYHHNGSLVVLKPKSKSKKYQPIILSDEFKIQGVVEAVISI